MFFFFKQKTAYDMRISDWSSDVCTSDLPFEGGPHLRGIGQPVGWRAMPLAPEFLVTAQYRRVDHAVGEALPSERPPASAGFRGEYRAAARQRVQILADHPGIIEPLAGVGDQRGYLVERIVRHQIVIEPGQIGRAHV